jgi:hypothetical protein
MNSDVQEEVTPQSESPSPTSFVSLFCFLPSAFITKIPLLPSRSLSKVILPLMPGKAASTGLAAGAMANRLAAKTTAAIAASALR